MKVYKGLKINFVEVLSNEVFKINNKSYYKCKCKCGKETYILSATLRSQRIRDCGCGEFARTRLIGQKFGKLLVIDATRNPKAKKKNIICICKCDCGKTVKVVASKLTSGDTLSCGCSRKFNFDIYKNKKIGKLTILKLVNKDKKIVLCKCDCGNTFKTKLYNVTQQKVISCGICQRKTNPCYDSDKKRLSSVWNDMIRRCYNSKDKAFKFYGERGISVCEEWVNNKSSFISWALSNGYKKGLSIDRINTFGNYEPTNCRWVTMKTQQNNRRNNVKFYFKGNYRPLLEIAEITGFHVETLRSRLRRGMLFNEAVTTPLQRNKRR